MRYETMKRNILNELVEGILSEAEADTVLNGILDSGHASDAEALLCLSRIEWTAHGHGALWTEIANWRRDRWPTKCSSCGCEIHVEEFGWRITEMNGSPGLKHIRCPIE
jgi:hypothetical protein